MDNVSPKATCRLSTLDSLKTNHASRHDFLRIVCKQKGAGVIWNKITLYHCAKAMGNQHLRYWRFAVKAFMHTNRSTPIDYCLHIELFWPFEPAWFELEAHLSAFDLQFVNFGSGK